MNLAIKYVGSAAALGDWLGSGASPVNPVVAQDRANVCVKCPHNKGGFTFASFMPIIKKLIEIKNREKMRVKGEKSLGVCVICHCHIATKVWTPIHHIENHTAKGEMPEHCWVEKEMNL